MDLLDAVRARVTAYQETGDRSLLTDTAHAEATALWNERLEPDGALPLAVVHALAWLYWCRYLAAERETDVLLAIELFRDLAQARPDLVPEPVARHLDGERDPAEAVRRAIGLLHRREQAERIVLDHAIKLLTGSADRLTDPAQRSDAHNALSVGLNTRFERFGDPADLDRAIDAARLSTRLAVQVGHPHTATTLSNLGVALRMRFARAGDVADLDEAVSHGRDAVRLARDPSDAARSRSMLALSLRARGDHLRSEQDLTEAVDLVRTVLAGTAVHDPALPLRLANLTSLLASRFGLTHDIADLDAAVTAAEDITATLSPDDPNLRLVTEALGSAHLTRFEAAGDRADLDEAVRASRVAAAPGTQDRAAALSRLGRVLRTRYQLYGEPADLDDAVAALREAVEGTPAGAPERPNHLSELGLVLRHRHALHGVESDLHDAVRVGRESVQRESLRRADHAARLSNFAGALTAAYATLGDEAHADEAIDMIRRAIEATPSDHPDLAGRLHNLSFSLHQRWLRRRSPHDLDEALAVGERSLAAARPDAPELPELGLGHALTLRERHERDGLTADADTVIEICQNVTMTARSPGTRLDAGVTWARTAGEAGKWADAVAGYRRAIAELPSVAWIGLRRADRERVVGDRGDGLAREAAAAAVLAGDAAAALESLEHGRTILWSQLLHSGEDLARLASVDPDLAAEIDRLRTEIAGFDQVNDAPLR